MDKLKQIPDIFIHMSLCLQALFGLRREESIKIIPAWADRGSRLVLKDSWTKAGREREIPICTREQRQLIDQAKALAKGKSLVAPRYSTYRDYLKYFRYQCERVGIHAFHGHRHFYAQARSARVGDVAPHGRHDAGGAAGAWSVEIRGDGQALCPLRTGANAQSGRPTCYVLVYSTERICGRSAASI